MTAIYARQSIDKKDSISIDTQIELCRRFADNAADCVVYSDKGWSGKNIDRPEFQRLLADVRRGIIQKIVVYKLDRISRSINDFSNLVELFRQYSVEFCSTVETFDTSTPMGRAMLGIIMVFAELERENILMRVKDNYYARGEKGLYLGGPPIYGFDKLPTRFAGVKTSVLVPNQHIHNVEYIFSAYSESRCSLGDIVKKLNDDNIPSPNGTLWDNSKISRLLRSPTYVMADADVYHYLKERGCTVSSPAEEFTGEHGCFLYGKRQSNERKYTNIRNHTASIGLHSGIIPSYLWLEVQKKLDSNMEIKRGKRGARSWLTGLIKCGRCGYALRIIKKDYFYCSGKANYKACSGFEHEQNISDIEQAVKHQLFLKFKEIQSVPVQADKPVQNPAVNKLKIELENISTQIDNLVEKISLTSSEIGKLLEEKLSALLIQRKELEKKIKNSSLTCENQLTYQEVLPLLSEFDSMLIPTRNAIAGIFIQKILLWDNAIEIIWKF